MVQEICQVDTGDAIALSVSFDKNSKLVAVGCSDAEIKMISVEKGEVVSVLKAHEDAVNGVVINQDNTALYSIGNDGTIRTWK
jgi:WD40 repeat protein